MKKGLEINMTKSNIGDINKTSHELLYEIFDEILGSVPSDYRYQTYKDIENQKDKIINGIKPKEAREYLEPKFYKILNDVRREKYPFIEKSKKDNNEAVKFFNDPVLNFFDKWKRYKDLFKD